MSTPHFALHTQPVGQLRTMEVPSLLDIPLSGRVSTVLAGDEVLRGQILARPPAVGPLKKNAMLCAPAAGTVLEVLPHSIRIRVGEDKAIDPADIAALKESALAERLAVMGFARHLLEHSTTLVINAVPHGPAISSCLRLMQDHKADLMAGLDLARQLITPSKTYLVTSSGDGAGFGNCTVVQVPARHPNGIRQMVVKAATGRETDEDVAVVNISELVRLGEVLRTGMPPSQVVLSVLPDDIRCTIGTPVGEVLAFAGMSINEGDRIVVGSPMDGIAAHTLDQGVGPDTPALVRIPAGAYPPMQDSPCIGCGECSRQCPARIQPDMISRMAEFKHFEKTRYYGVDYCFECGICGYWCPSRRPLLQYIRMARQELAALDADMLPDLRK